jgi:hypothetical protein
LVFHPHLSEACTIVARTIANEQAMERACIAEVGVDVTMTRTTVNGPIKRNQEDKDEPEIQEAA